MSNVLLRALAHGMAIQLHAMQLERKNRDPEIDNIIDVLEANSSNIAIEDTPIILEATPEFIDPEFSEFAYDTWSKPVQIKLLCKNGEWEMFIRYPNMRTTNEQ